MDWGVCEVCLCEWIPATSTARPLPKMPCCPYNPWDKGVWITPVTGGGGHFSEWLLSTVGNPFTVQI